MSVKRLVDLIFSFLGLILLSPVILLGWLASTLDLRKNGWFSQERIGQKGKPFRIWKIRTIAPQVVDNTVFVPSENLRKIGRFLRKTKIDELPQLWNVLKGEMSFVGPRPDVKEFADLLEGEDRKILELKPGLTSMASIEYANEEQILSEKANPLQYNKEVIYPHKVQMNLWYYHHQSFLLDVRILMKTLYVLLKPRR
jgi:lipopolysaccharide/colanic/teichoic acid biosynthesis glycosyltransferase